jgi:hypothetical protein
MPWEYWHDKTFDSHIAPRFPRTEQIFAFRAIFLRAVTHTVKIIAFAHRQGIIKRALLQAHRRLGNGKTKITGIHKFFIFRLRVGHPRVYILPHDKKLGLGCIALNNAPRFGYVKMVADGRGFFFRLPKRMLLGNGEHNQCLQRPIRRTKGVIALRHHQIGVIITDGKFAIIGENILF